MDLRWRLVVVTGAGSGLGREVAVRLGRRGAGVVAVDRDGRRAEETATLVRRSRVQAWSMTADVTLDGDLDLLAARLRDLGGADVLVTTWDPDLPDLPGSPDLPDEAVVRALRRSTDLFIDDVVHRRGRADEPGAVVHVAPPSYAVAQQVCDLVAAPPYREPTAQRRPSWEGDGPAVGTGGVPLARITGVLLAADSPFAAAAAAVLDLAAHGRPGQVVDLRREGLGSRIGVTR